MDESLDAIRNWWRSFRGNDADIEWKNVKQEFWFVFCKQRRTAMKLVTPPRLRNESVREYAYRLKQMYAALRMSDKLQVESFLTGVCNESIKSFFRVGSKSNKPASITDALRLLRDVDLNSADDDSWNWTYEPRWPFRDGTSTPRSPRSNDDSAMERVNELLEKLIKNQEKQTSQFVAQIAQNQSASLFLTVE